MSKYVIEDTTLTAIADAVREKAGTTELIQVSELPDAIAAIESGGGGDIPEEAFSFTGSINNLFSSNNWKYFLDNYATKMKFNNINSAQNVFLNSDKFTDLSKLTINTNDTNIQSMFNGCRTLIKLPKLIGTVTRYFNTLFSHCQLIREDEINKFFDNITVLPTNNNTSYSSIFQDCYSVRNLTKALDWFHININNYTGTSTSAVNYNNWFYFCAGLDEITNMPVIYCGGAKTSNAFGNVVYFAGRLKEFMFKTNDGEPFAVNWKSQTLDLQDIGTTNYSYVSNVTDRNSGITSDKRVTDAASYEALKNDPDWFTTIREYSRYNHDSAVNTINSLPDTSAYLATAGGTNTIKFRGIAGAYTDGGAINTLTEEEIAVATAKGWTVTLT